MQVDRGDAATIEAQSALSWWVGAGVDIIVDEAPRDWMARAAQIAGAPPPPLPAEPAMPGDLASFREWLATSELPAGSGARVAPAGDPAAGLMILADMPEGGDAAQGALIGGEAGRLFDRMLAAIGRDRGSIYLASLSPGHFAAGKVPAAAIEALAPVALHHVALAAPRMLLLLGDAPALALLGMPMPRARGRLHEINHDGATVAVVSTFHPRFLLQHPACKADAWADLRLMLGGLSQ